MRVFQQYTESSVVSDQPIETTAFHTEGTKHAGWVVGYPKAVPPFARVIFIAPVRPEHVVTYEDGNMPDFNALGAVEALVNQAVALETVTN